MALKIMEVSKVIKAPIGEAWGIISAFGGEKLWFPGVVKSSLEGYGVGAVRSLTFANMPKPVRERLESVDAANHTLRYRIFNEHLKSKSNYATITLEAVDKERTKFTWLGESDLLDPSQKGDLAKFLEGMYHANIDAIAAKLSS